MKATESSRTERTTKRPWQTPRVESSEVFNKAALACCLNPFNQPVGSSGAGLPVCPD